MIQGVASQRCTRPVHGIWRPGLAPFVEGARILAAVALVLCLSGCSYALHQHVEPGQEKLRLVTDRGGQYAIRVQDQGEMAVPADGRVVVGIPTLSRGCSVYLFGFMRIENGDPKRIRVIEVLRDGRVVRRLSLRALQKLAVDSDGYRLIPV